MVDHATQNPITSYDSQQAYHTSRRVLPENKRRCCIDQTKRHAVSQIHTA